MPRLNYDEGLVNNALDLLDQGKTKLSTTENDISSAVSLVYNARGAEYINVSNIATGIGLADQCVDLIDNTINGINSRVEAIIEYNKDYDAAPFWKKALSTVGMGAAKIGEGFVGAFEDIGDAACLLGAWVTKPVDLVLKTKISDSILDFEKRDLSRELFDFIYYDRDAAKYSAMSADGVVSSVFRGIGQAAGYICMGGYLGGANNFLARTASEGSKLAKVTGIFQSTTNANALVAAVGGLGSGSEDALDHGYGILGATLSGLKEAAIQGGMAYAAGKLGERQQIKQAQKNLANLKNPTNLEAEAQRRLTAGANGTGEWAGYKGLSLEQAKAKILNGAEEHYYQMVGKDGSMKYITENMDDILARKQSLYKSWQGLTRDEAEKKLLAQFAKRGDFTGEIAKLGGFTDRLTSKAYTKGFYDMQNLHQVYTDAGGGAAGIFKAATIGQFKNVSDTVTSPGKNIYNKINDYREYKAALKEIDAAKAAGQKIPKDAQKTVNTYLSNKKVSFGEYRAAQKEIDAAKAAGEKIPASAQMKVDKYLNNRGMDIFRVSNVNPTNNIAKGGALSDALSHSYKLSHTRAIVGNMAGTVAAGATSYIAMNGVKDTLGDIGQYASQKAGLDVQPSRAIFVNENRKYHNGKDIDLTPTTAPTTPSTVPSTIPTTPPPKSTQTPRTTPPTTAPPTTPTTNPTPAPTTAPKTTAPTKAPTPAPTKAPVVPTTSPTKAPTTAPFRAPTSAPTKAPTKAPVVKTPAPTAAPTKAPTTAPPTSPTTPPTPAPTSAPTSAPTTAPVIEEPSIISTIPVLEAAVTHFYPNNELIPNTGILGKDDDNYLASIALGAGLGVAASVAESEKEKEEEEEKKEKEENNENIFVEQIDKLGTEKA